jgi:hypothetical protein
MPPGSFIPGLTISRRTPKVPLAASCTPVDDLHRRRVAATDRRLGQHLGGLAENQLAEGLDRHQHLDEQRADVGQPQDRFAQVAVVGQFPGVEQAVDDDAIDRAPDRAQAQLLGQATELDLREATVVLGLDQFGFGEPLFGQRLVAVVQRDE